MTRRRKKLFSEKHYQEGPKPGTRKSSKRKQQELPPVFEGNLGPPSEEQRKALREAQLRGAEVNPRPDQIRSPLTDPDLGDIDEAENLRQPYQTMLGPTHAPEVLGPQPDKKPDYLTDNDIMDGVRPDDSDMDWVHRRRFSSEEEERFAAISLTDEQIQRVDNSLSDFYRSVGSLLNAARSLEEHTRLEGSPVAHDSAQRFRWVLEDAIDPWARVLEQLLQGVIDQTTEGDSVKQTGMDQEPVEPGVMDSGEGDVNPNPQ